MEECRPPRVSLLFLAASSFRFVQPADVDSYVCSVRHCRIGTTEPRVIRDNCARCCRYLGIGPQAYYLLTVREMRPALELLEIIGARLISSQAYYVHTVREM